MIIDFIIYFLPGIIFGLIYFGIGATGFGHRFGLIGGTLVSHLFVVPIILFPYFGFLFAVFALPGTVIGYILGYLVRSYDIKHEKK